MKKAQKTEAPVLKMGQAAKVAVAQGFLMMFPRAIYEVAKVSNVGKTKYGRWFNASSFLHVPGGEALLLDAQLRHVLDEAIKGPMNTEHGGGIGPDGLTVRHAAQAVWEAIAKLELTILREEQASAKK